MGRRASWTVGVVGLLILAVGWGSARAGEPEMPLVFEEGFETGEPLAKWQPMDPASWKIAEQDGNKVLSLFKNSTYSPPVRSPLNFALIRDVFVGDFVLELRMQSAKKEYPHLDLCLFFGYQDPTHFYYAHIAAVADPLAHSVTVVDGKPRVSIVKERTQGVKWGTGWHKVRLERKVADGTVKVFFDDMTKPVMTAEDKRFAWGRVGVGSFDDLGNFDDVKLWGIKVEPPKEKKEAQ